MKKLCEFKMIYSIFLIGVFVLTASVAKSASRQQIGHIGGYPIDSSVLTTRQQTIVPDLIPSDSPKIYPYEVAKYKQYGYGNWHYEPGVNFGKLLDLMPASYNGSSVTNTLSLLNFFTMTDIHITDEETPTQAIVMGFKGGTSSAYSPVMLYTTQVLDAAVQTINALNKTKRFDFGISLGDVVNSDQYNELRWYIDVLDGKNISPDSGDKDDPVPGPYNDYQDVFKAAGLDKTIPWYQTLGNHDHFWMGFYPANDYVRQFVIGDEIINLGNMFTDTRALDSRGYYMGSIDGRTPYGDVIGAGRTSDFAIPPKIPASDPNRRLISKNELMSEFFKTSSNPIGHGFTQANLNNNFASYSFEPKSKIPIKIIVLDDTQSDNEPIDIHSLGYGHASIDQKRYEWLVDELDKGQAEDKLMIIAAHIPIGVEPAGAMNGWSSNAVISEASFITKLHEYPNLILLAAGHRHRNTVTAFKSPDPNHPELGFWQVETSSLRDFTQQFRTFDITCNSDNTVSIITTDVDPAVSEGSLAAISRSYAVASQQMFKNSQASQPSGAYNAELVKQLTPQMQLKLAKLRNWGHK